MGRQVYEKLMGDKDQLIKFVMWGPPMQSSRLILGLKLSWMITFALPCREIRRKIFKDLCALLNK